MTTYHFKPDGTVEVEFACEKKWQPFIQRLVKQFDARYLPASTGIVVSFIRIEFKSSSNVKLFNAYREIIRQPYFYKFK